MAMTHRYTGGIWAKEWEERGAREELMGTGPSSSWRTAAGVSKYKRNPEYHRQLPYFDEIDFLGVRPGRS